MSISNARHLTLSGKRVVRLTRGEALLWKGLPAGYRQVEYIQCTGSEYINTGIVPNQDTRVVCRFWYTGGNGIYGARNTVATRNFSLRVIAGAWQLGYGDGVTTGTVKADTTAWHTADQNKNKLYIDGILAAERAYTAFAAPYPIAIGAIRAGSVYYGEGKYQTFRIYQNGILVRDMLPCLDPTGAAGMYDTVEAKFYPNAGTGTILAGPAV